MVVGSWPHTLAALPGEPRCVLNRRIGGSQSRYGRFGAEINLLPLSRIEPRFLDCAARSLVPIPAPRIHPVIIYKLCPFYFFFPMARQPLGGLGRLIFLGFTITHFLDTPHSIGLLWTRDQLVAETSTWQHTTLTRDRHPCPRRDSNPQSQ
jgi:hypothetical protein